MDPVPTERQDEQRAAALLSHLAAEDQDGVQFIVKQSTEANRATELLAAIADAGGKLLAALRTDMGIEAASSLLDTWANQTENVDYRRAASIILCRFQFEHDYFVGHINDATADGRLTELIVTTAQIYLTVMPELHSPKGRASLAQITSALYGEQ
ncbi:hypothetical protein QN239_27425 [Mycolicibacterium sp. Y3]